MKDFYNQTNFDRKGVFLESSYQTLLWSLTVSMFPLGGFFGSLMVGPLVNKCGRKGTLLINNIFSIVPAILMGTSKVAKTFEVIILSRIIVGICAGLSSNVVPMYLGEISPKNLRGAIGVVPQLFITIGILVAQILGLTSILGNLEGKAPNSGKCKVMHLGTNNKNFSYKLATHQLEVMERRRTWVYWLIIGCL
uniref:Major facilitator superfamily (MFS) profile domain-containing protein n=1 Tax=Pelusios castaneus TaxID=367368 RepID=A0A8C8SVT1_9SAUR